jgi:hypothetical protein
MTRTIVLSMLLIGMSAGGGLAAPKAKAGPKAKTAPKAKKAPKAEAAPKAESPEVFAPTSQPAEADSRRLESAWARIEARRPDLSAPELMGFALDAVAAGAAAPRVEAALDLAEAMQDRDPNSRSFGNFRWYWRSTKVEDYNAVEFAMQRGALIRLKYYDRLTDAARQRLDRLVRFGVQGIRRHTVQESYTNIFLMKAFNCLALGEAAGEAELAAEGSRMLDRWLMATWESGLREYLSPTYYGVDVECLGLIARHVADASARAKAEAALALFWTDIAANWFEPGMRLGGPHSRDFDSLTGHGYLDNYLALAGWIPTDATVGGGVLRSLSMWMPPAKLTRPILSNLPRTICRRWGDDESETAVNYVGKSVSVGSAGACYGPTDKVLTVDLGGGPMTPVASFVMDGRGDPYGASRQTGAGGHSKAMHLCPFVATVQRGPEALLLASADTNNAGHFRYVPAPTCLLSHLVLPLADELWIAERRINLDSRGDAVAVFAGQPVFLRCGKAALAVRVPLAVDTAGNPAPVAIFADGGKYGAMRLTVAHCPDAPKGIATVAVWVRAAEGIDNDADFASFRRSFASLGSATFADGRAELSVPGLKGKLRIFADVWKARRIAVEGGEKCPADCVLSIDGKEVGRKLLEGLDVIRQYRSLLDGKSPGTVSAGQTIEAEDAALIAPPFVAGSDPKASGGKFVWVTGQAGGEASGGVGRAVWVVNVPAEGLYTLAARVQTPTDRDDSFLVRIRQRGRDVLARKAWQAGAHTKWQWVDLPDQAGNSPLHIRLHAGPAVIEVFSRQDGARLDAIRLDPPRRNGDGGEDK